MKKMIFLILVGSIIIAQPQALRRPFSPKEIPNSQDIHRMVNDQVMNRSTSQLAAQTGRPTKEVEQMWNGSAWENDNMTENVYAAGKTKGGQFHNPIFVYYFLWLSGAWSANGHDEWSYDNEGNLTEILWYLYGVAYYRLTFIGPFTNGQPAARLDQWDNNGVWTDDMRVTYTYDNNGCRIDEVWEWWNSTAWEYSWRQQYYYRQACCPGKWVFSYWENNAWLIYHMAAFTYAYANCMTDMVPFLLPYGIYAIQRLF